MNPFRAMVEREDNAFNRFADCMNDLGFNRSEVTKIWNTYLKLKVMKVDQYFRDISSGADISLLSGESVWKCRQSLLCKTDA